MTNRMLEKNIKNAFGDMGVIWLHSLPLLIEKLSRFWSLTNIEPASNMNWNYVAYATQHKKINVAFKMSYDPTLIKNEYHVLTYFDGHGAIKLLDYSEEHHAILLERALPGRSLKENDPAQIQETIHSYSQVIKKIASLTLPNSSFCHVNTWLDAIDHIRDLRIDKRYVDKAKQLKSHLLQSSNKEYLCHGDLHLENIIQNKNDWLAIDPKGIIGEMAFEAAAFDLLYDDEMTNIKTGQSKIIDRIQQLSNALKIDNDRLLSWVFLRIMISIQWFVEDKGDPSRMIQLANYVYPLLKN